MESRVRSMLAWLMMAGLCGAIGFAIVYYYSTNVRPVERFAIVIDAGSTQTRSNLFRISLDPDDLAEELELATAAQVSGSDSELQQNSQRAGQVPLGELIKVQQVSSCVNGGPLAAIAGPLAARDLVRKCLVKFAEHIKLLDFVHSDSTTDGHQLEEEEEEDQLQTSAAQLDADELSKQMALINHRVNSITHLHLGATAGMRALEQLNGTRARERLAWMEAAIGESNSMLRANSPHVNRGFVGILAGADEASFGWLSVNFVCDALNASVTPAGAGAAHDSPSPHSINQGAHQQSSNVVYATMLEEGHTQPPPVATQLDLEPVSVGTLELGGASAQMAFQVVNNGAGSRQVANTSLHEQQLELFNGHYKLATRSDLCLGMSQAVLRLNYVLLHEKIMNNSSTTREEQVSDLRARSLEVANACMQRGARLTLTGAQLAKLWQGACLAPSTTAVDHQDGPSAAQLEQARIARLLLTQKDSVEFRGTGQVDECARLLGELIEPAACRRYFSLCPERKNTHQPPASMPFVTISGYNHALKVLELKPAQSDHQSSAAPSAANNTKWRQLSAVVDDKLGGSPVSYQELLDKTRQFCATEVADLAQHYPRSNKLYANITCLQLVYIRKLLTEFYQFDPETPSWSQIRFLVFAPKSVPEQYTRVNGGHSSASDTDVQPPDIGWTLGLLLNATSQQLGSGQEEIYFHHGATVMYIVRTIILMMFACFLIAIAFLVVGIIEVRLAQQRGDAYVSHSSSSLENINTGSSYDIRSLGPSRRNTQQQLEEKYITNEGTNNTRSILIKVQQYDNTG